MALSNNVITRDPMYSEAHLFSAGRAFLSRPYSIIWKAAKP